MNRFNLLILLTIALLGSTLLVGQIKLDMPLGNHMVLQQGKEIKINGSAGKNENLTITFNGQQINIISNYDGYWKTILPKQQAGGPYSLLIEGQQEQVCDMDPIAAPRVRQVPSLSRLHSLLLDVFCRQGATRT